MRHIEIKNLWLQKEVREGNIDTLKVLGTENPADLMTKVLGVNDIMVRTRLLNIYADFRGDVRGRTA